MCVHMGVCHVHNTHAWVFHRNVCVLCTCVWRHTGVPMCTWCTHQCVPLRRPRWLTWCWVVSHVPCGCGVCMSHTCRAGSVQLGAEVLTDTTCLPATSGPAPHRCAGWEAGCGHLPAAPPPLTSAPLAFVPLTPAHTCNPRLSSSTEQSTSSRLIRKHKRRRRKQRLRQADRVGTGGRAGGVVLPSQPYPPGPPGLLLQQHHRLHHVPEHHHRHAQHG